MAHGDMFEEGRPDTVTHELEHGRLVVAEDDAAVVGFGAILERGGAAYLADLFLLPDRVGRGLGTAIMRELFPEPGERFTFASSDPRALALYVRHGMRIFTPLLYLKGDAVTAARLPDPEVTLEEADTDEVEALDARSFGRRRPQDLAFMRSAGDARLVARRGARTVGYGFVRVAPRPDGPRALLNPSGAETEKDLTATAFALLRHATTLAPAVDVAVLGTQPALPALLAAGFRVEDRDTFMATRPELIDPTRYLPSPAIG